MPTTTKHHQEIFSVPDLSQPEAFQYRHLSSRDGETRRFDERCPGCLWIREQWQELSGGAAFSEEEERRELRDVVANYEKEHLHLRGYYTGIDLLAILKRWCAKKRAEGQ